VANQHRIADGTRGYTWRLTGSVYGEIDLLRFFRLKSTFGLDVDHRLDEHYMFTRPELGLDSYPNKLLLAGSSAQNWVWSNTLNFEKEFGDHYLTAIMGAEFRRDFSEGSNAEGQKLAYGDDPNYRVLSNTDPKTYDIGSFKTENRMSSIFMNATYSFKNKYIVTGTVRRDGSSLFINNRYGTFPAISVAWRMSQENFLRSVSLLHDLKLRASYGATGNNEVLGGNYPGYTQYATSKGGNSYDIHGTGNSIVPGFSRTSVGNPDLKWETSIVADVGLDASLWRNIDVTLDWFKRETKDMLYPVQLPLQDGAFYQNQNVGSMLNQGIEFQLGYHGTLMENKLSLTANLSATHYENKVTALYADSVFYAGAVGPLNFTTITQADYPISQFWGFVAEGLWQSQEQIDTVLFANPGGAKPGRMKFRDVNEDGVIDNRDKTLIGSPIPKLILGLTLTLSFKSFDVSVFVNGTYGRKVFNAQHMSDFISGTKAYPSKSVLYEAGKTLPVLDKSDTYSYQASTYYVEDASYTRLRNLVIGYTLPRVLSSKVGLQKVRFYIQGQNLFTWTKYSGLDPEGSISNVGDAKQQQRDYVTGVDNFDHGRYPPARQFILGLNLEF